MTLEDTRRVNRRQFLNRNAMGIGSVALAWLLQQDELLATPKDIPRGPRSFDLLPRPTHHPQRAESMISLFMHGGPSHMDLFDPKPELTRHSGEDYPGSIKYSFVKRASKQLLGSPWKFRRHGECGTDVSELLPHIAGVVDDLCLIRSMHTDINGHESSIWYMNTGRSQPGRPALGSWLTYGLGSETRDLPAYIVLPDPAGHPVDGVRNWSNGWMPPLFQGTVVRLQAQGLAFLAELNRRHLVRHRGEADLEARIAAYELAARMQTSAREALDISKETKATQELYGLHEKETREYGTRCLIARRLVERGVRFVQLFLSYQPWDNHSNIRETLPAICRKTDRPAAALVADLKQRGLLETTLVHWGGEIGRLPVVENHGDLRKCGRDHNGQGFSTWLAGGGVRGGIILGETDEFGHRAVADKVSPSDYQATLLHLFGIDHRQLVYHHNGQQQRLTDNKPCRVVREILA